ncbi:MAG: polysaccharide deacetylase family protein [Desulfobacterium sp.]|nr:polysaccharide deacetylase family protein [Desulfobacterium sp.]
MEEDTITNPAPGSPITISHLLGFFALSTALLLSVWDIRLSTIPLAFFVLSSFIAPFFTSISYFLPVITCGKSSEKAVSLTFDDGPDPVSTPALLNLLKNKNILATFFVTGENASRHPDLIQAILRQGHTIGNHSYHHDPLIMLKNSKRLFQEIQLAQDILKTFGIHTLAFRPPAGITNPKLGKILSGLGMYCVNYSCRAFDMGNRRIQNLSGKILRKIQPGDIVLLHDIIPAKEKKQWMLKWLVEIEGIVDGIQKKGWEVIPLANLIHRPVMKSIRKVTDAPHHECPNLES